MVMAEGFVQPWEASGRRFVCRRTGSVDSHQFSPGRTALLLLSLLALMLALLASPGLAPAAETGPTDGKIIPQGPVNFETCVRLALQQSPYLTKSSVEIDIKRLDENDSRYSMFPPGMTFRSYYYVDRPRQVGLSPKPYSLSFNMDPYNPFGSYFTLQAQKMVTQMAIFAHLKIISEGLERVGKLFLNLGVMKRMIHFQGDLINLSRENLIYAENRQSIGTGTSLEVRVATQELEFAKSEKERLELHQKRTLSSLKAFMGLQPDQQVDFDLRDTRRQVLGAFDPAAATLEQAKARSYELKMLEMKKEMQGYHITLAKTKVLPNFLFTTQTPDPLSVTNARGFYVGLGLEVPVWDGLKRIRDVSRQKAVLKQFGAEKDLKDLDLTDKWNALQEDLKVSSAALKATQAQEELTRLKERQGEIRYHSGSETLPTWLDTRKASLEAQKNAATRSLENDIMILGLRQLSGDLGYTYVDQNSWQK
jgi:hypothetical protein